MKPLLPLPFTMYISAPTRDATFKCALSKKSLGIISRTQVFQMFLNGLLLKLKGG